MGIVVVWSDAEIGGLNSALGREKARAILEGCQVHWTRSWQRVRDHVASSNNKGREMALVSLISTALPKTSAGNNTGAFSVLCKEKPSHVYITRSADQWTDSQLH